MRRHATWIASLALILLLPVRVALSSASHEAFVVIVHPQNPATAIDRTVLRAAYLKEGVRWSDGSIVVPISLAERFPAHTGFVQHVLNKSVGALRNYWYQRIFSGTGVPPTEAATPDEALARVLADRHAVTYLPADANRGRAKVINVR